MISGKVRYLLVELNDDEKMPPKQTNSRSLDSASKSTAQRPKGKQNHTFDSTQIQTHKYSSHVVNKKFIEYSTQIYCNRRCN